MLVMGSNQSTKANFPDTLSVLDQSLNNVTENEPVPRRTQPGRRLSFTRRTVSEIILRRNSATEDVSQPASSSSPKASLVIVNEPQVIDIAKDSTIVRLNSIPFFNPIFQNPERVWSKEVDQVRRKLDSEAFLNIGSLIQSQVRKETMTLSRNQNQLSAQVKEIDQTSKRLFRNYTDRQRTFAKNAESLSRINEFAHLLAKFQAILNDCRRTAELVNNLLPECEKLESFTWVDDT